MNETKARISREVEALADDLYAVSDYLLANPELGYQEFLACEHLSQFLGAHGFDVERGVGGVETAFKARPAGGALQRPSVAFLAEYDALPEIGHGCGHNLIAAASIGAAVALGRSLDSGNGSLAVIGTPAEEGGGGKVRLAEAGVFEDIDAAMMVHPGQYNLPGKDFLGRIKFKLEFFGRTAHAAVSPEQGINALDALIATFNAISALRQHIRPDARIHGIVTHGGEAPNIIPDYAAGLFYVRSADRAYRDELFERVRKCAEGAALATGATTKATLEPPAIDPMKRNAAFEQAFEDNMGTFGIPVDGDDGGRGSSDMGNLSHVVPAIHPFLAIVEPEVPSHSVAFAEATQTPRGRQALLQAAKTLAATAYDFLDSKDLRERVAGEFSGQGC